MNFKMDSLNDVSVSSPLVAEDEDTNVSSSFSDADLDITDLSFEELDTTGLSDSLAESLVNSSYTSSSSDTHLEDEDEPCSVTDFQLLYNGSKLTTFDSYLLIMKYGLRHGLTKQALSDLLNLIEIHLPSSITSSHGVSVQVGVHVLYVVLHTVPTQTVLL